MGRLLSSRDRFGGMRARRAVVKTRLVRIGTKGMPAARAHLRYIQRDGVTRGGAPGELYSAERDTADGKAFLQRRSEEHTSELQSLMRIPYADFRLQKKNKHDHPI